MKSIFTLLVLLTFVSGCSSDDSAVIASEDRGIYIDRQQESLLNELEYQAELSFGSRFDVCDDFLVDDRTGVVILTSLQVHRSGNVTELIADEHGVFDSGSIGQIYEDGSFDADYFPQINGAGFSIENYVEFNNGRMIVITEFVDAFGNVSNASGENYLTRISRDELEGANDMLNAFCR